ncbi:MULTISPECIES: hypothetical protein [Rhizobium/Agrobacterium group]|uniref:hypothetical protein n=1 Tax=Rhizobium/Agrobacterium group TaxID=227290 RepID=UPI00166E3C3E|nr:hypothetical protein [Rhizobium rhizogenes]
MKLFLLAQETNQLGQALVDHIGLQRGISHVHHAAAVEVAGRIHDQHALADG